MKVKVSADGGQVGRVEREAWNAVASLRPGGVGIQIVSQVCGVLLPSPLAKTLPLASCAHFGWRYAQCWASSILNPGTFLWGLFVLHLHGFSRGVADRVTN